MKKTVPIIIIFFISTALYMQSGRADNWYHGTKDLWTTPTTNRKPWHDELDKAYAAEHQSDPGRVQGDHTKVADLERQAGDHYKRAIQMAISSGAFADAAKAEYEYAIHSKLLAAKQEAINAFEKCIEYDKRAHHDDTVIVGDCYMQIGQLLDQLNKQGIAVTYAKKAYQIYSQLLSANDVKLSWPLELLILYAASPEDAIPYRKQLIEVLKKSEPDEAGQIGLAIFGLAKTLADANKLQEAIAQAEQAIDWLKKEPGNYAQSTSIEELISIWRRREMGIEPQPGVIYTGKFAGRDPREKPSEKAGDRPEGNQRRYYIDGKLVSEARYRSLELSNRACDQIANRHYEQALEMLNQALTLDPELSEVHANIGIVLKKLGKRDEAIKHLTSAVRLSPEKASPLVMLASAYQADGQLDKAIEAYKVYQSKFPDEADGTVVSSLIRDLTKLRTEQKSIEKASGNSSEDYLAYCIPKGKVRWSSVIKVYIAQAKNLHGYQPNFPSTVRKSFEDWAAHSKKLSFQFVDNKKDADIDCFFTNDFRLVDSPSEAGETRELFDTSGKFKHCTIVLMTENATSNITPGAADIRAVALHEIGHASGLMGHSPSPADIMFCTAPDDTEVRYPQLSNRDLNTMTKLYSD